MVTQPTIIMLKKILLAAFLLTGAATASMAQYVTYESIYANRSPQTTTSDNANLNVQVVTGYVINPSTKEIYKVRLKVAQVQRSVLVTGVKELSSEYWSDFTVNRPVAQKIYSYEQYSDQFEYKVYVPVLGKVVYF